jgi:REP element-mobilizing transposase RayT
MFEIAAEKGIKLIEAEAIVDHVHLLLDCEDKASLSSALMYLKGVSSRRWDSASPPSTRTPAPLMFGRSATARRLFRRIASLRFSATSRRNGSVWSPTTDLTSSRANEGRRRA